MRMPCHPWIEEVNDFFGLSICLRAQIIVILLRIHENGCHQKMEIVVGF